MADYPPRDLFEPLNDYYVTMLRGERKPRVAFLAGPFDTHAAALDMVDRARSVALEIDSWAAFDYFGTSSLPKAPENPRGKINERLGIKSGNNC